ncbi:hypothetical protein PVK06_007016 [Gossypium arboreum]|uniref:Uncharacterized protein n=1 Tax=Gossypium arboreum TaxID=29729 RepID=A0ABR0QGB1_GOSAR|nr:hypothetical protein PVK06_007016 [Gossypium arboreum]
MNTLLWRFKELRSVNNRMYSCSVEETGTWVCENQHGWLCYKKSGQAGAGTVIRDYYGNWLTGSTLLLRFQQWTLNAMARKGSSFQTLSSSDSYLHADSCFICNGDLLSYFVADATCSVLRKQAHSVT